MADFKKIIIEGQEVLPVANAVSLGTKTAHFEEFGDNGFAFYNNSEKNGILFDIKKETYGSTIKIGEWGGDTSFEIGYDYNATNAVLLSYDGLALIRIGTEIEIRNNVYIESNIKITSDLSNLIIETSFGRVQIPYTSQ